MAARPIDQNTLEEKIIRLGIVGFWPVYLVGGLYVLGAVIGWTVLAIVLLRWFVEGAEAFNSPPVLSYLWVVGMLLLALALLISHNNWNLGPGQTVKSFIGWMKGWALLALFICLGSVIKINTAHISRAVCITAFAAIPFFLISLTVYVFGGPEVLLVSPLQAVGGPGPEYFEIRFFGLNPETGMPRWFFFAPWAPAAGLLGCLFMVISLQEQHALWRNLGVLGCVLMVVCSQSRAGLAIILMIVPILLVLKYIRFSYSLAALGLLLPLVFLLGSPLIEGIIDLLQQVKDSRPGSTRVREALAEIALQRWSSEAPIWGHGIVEPGPKIVEHMPIGTHHSWYGLLFTKGLLGAIGLAVPLLCTFVYLFIAAQRSVHAVAGFGLILVISLYSFFENLEILAYLYWPALLWIGFCLNPCNDEPKTV